MIMRHINLPIFVPHLGCPNACVFCNQHLITSVTRFSMEDARETLEKAIASLPRDAVAEIAFFGGSFTAIDRDLMTSLLSLAESYVQKGLASSIRLSTRPDAINDEILTVLKQYSVRTVELGIQSTDDHVLQASRRGHTKEDSENAARLIRSYGFSLVGQMMLGLPDSTPETDLATARDMIAFGIHAARIYPTVVFPHTDLFRMSQTGAYHPLTVEEAVERGGEVLACFWNAGIPVIRIGLCESDELRDTPMLEGAYHPALGEMIRSRAFLKKIQEELSKNTLPEHAEITVEIAPVSLSQAIGHKKYNRLLLSQYYPNHSIRFRENPILSETEVKIHVKEN